MSISRYRWRGGTVMLAIVVTAGLGLAGGRAAAAPSSQPAPGWVNCTTGHGEWASCVAVRARLERVLALGGTARLSVGVDTQVDLPAATVSAVLPANLAWASPPEGFQVTRQAPTTFDTGGSTQTAVGLVHLSPGHRLTVSGTVRAVATGQSIISVRVAGPVGHPEDVGTATVLAAVGTGVNTSYLGFRAGPSASAPLPAGVALSPSVPGLKPKRLTGRGLPLPPPGTVSPQALACATGSWTYQDQNQVWHPQVNIQVQLVARGNLLHGNDVLGVGLTDQNGSYRLCGDASHRDIFVREITDNAKWTVDNDRGGQYIVNSPTVSHVGSGTTTDFGSLFPSDPAFMRAMHAFDEANDASTWAPGDCWTPGELDCKVIHIRWTATSTDGTFYDPNSDTVHLTGPDPDVRSAVVHELGHAVMDDAYRDNFPNVEPACAHHTIQNSFGIICGWVEGFADWFQAAVYDDPVYDFGGGNVLNLEDPTWGTPGWDNGDSVEGRVAGAMIDLTDSHNEPYWDRHTEANPGPLLQTLDNHQATRFSEFWTQRGQDHFDVGPGALAALYQNTIDYQFREPLADYTPLTRPTPPTYPGGHNYQFQTTKVFWSVVAVRPPATADYDLYLYDDLAQTNAVGASALGTGTVDFLAIDSNFGRRPLGSYYPRVSAFTGNTGTGEYQIELAQGANLLQTSEQIPMGAGEVDAVRDVCLTTGNQITLTLSPSDPSQYGELFVMADDPGNSGSWVQSRGSAAAASPNHNPGEATSLAFTAPGTACYGVVLINRSGSGTYTLARS